MLSQRAISRVFNANIATTDSLILFTLIRMRFGFFHATFSFTFIRICSYHFQLRVYYLFILLIVDFNFDLSMVLEYFLVLFFFHNLVLSVVLAAAHGLPGHTIVADGDH